MTIKVSKAISHLKIPIFVFAGLMIVTLGVTGCTSTYPPPSIPMSQSSPTDTFQARITDSPVFTPSKTTLPTWTAIPSLPQTKTSIPTWTPLPTLSDTQSENELLNWLQGTPNCLLPCWGGIRPGITTWQEAKQALSSVVSIQGVDENWECPFGQCKDIGWKSRSLSDDLEGYMISKSDIIFKIGIDGHPPTPLLRVDRILSQYGPPEKVFLTATPNDQVPLLFTLAYPNHQFIIFYEWSITMDANARYIRSCIQAGYVYLTIIQTDEQWTDDFIKVQGFGSGALNDTMIKPLEEVTDMTIETFYDKFKNIDGKACIVSPVQSWLPK